VQPKEWVRFVILGIGAASLMAGQAVISARSGVVHFTEGSVYVDGQPIEHQAGKFETLKNGSELRTKDGRAEVLLASGVFLRLNGKSAIRMISNSLGDGRLEMLEGSALVESAKMPAGAHMTLVYKDYEIAVPESGTLRVDADPPKVTVQKGEVEISLRGEKSTVKESQSLELSGGAALAHTEKAKQGNLEDWAKKRDSSISNDDKSADKVTDDLSVAEDWEDSIDASGLGLARSGTYSGLAPYSGVPSIPAPGRRSWTGVTPSPLPIVPLTPLGSYLYTTPGYPYIYPYSVLSYSPLLVQRGFVPLYVGAGVGRGLYSPLPIWRTRAPGSLGPYGPTALPRVPIGTTAMPHTTIGPRTVPPGVRFGGHR
jgi:hypothetical protein